MNEKIAACVRTVALDFAGVVLHFVANKDE